MKPIEFPQANTVFAKDQPEYLPLPAYRSPNGMEVTACWGMSWRERFRTLLTGRVYVTLLTFGKPLTPSLVSTEPPQPQPTMCWQHRPDQVCPHPQSCSSNGCSAVERELFP